MQMLAPTIPMKTEESTMKEENVQQGGVMGSGPGRPENAPTPMDTELNASSMIQILLITLIHTQSASFVYHHDQR